MPIPCTGVFLFFYVFGEHMEGLLVHQRQSKCGCLVALVVFMRTHPTHYYLESCGSATPLAPVLRGSIKILSPSQVDGRFIPT